MRRGRLLIIVKRWPNPTYYFPLSPGINKGGPGSCRCQREGGWLRRDQLMPPIIAFHPFRKLSSNSFFVLSKDGIISKILASLQDFVLASHFVYVTLSLLLRSEHKHMCRLTVELTSAENIHLHIAVCFEHLNS